MPGRCAADNSSGVRHCGIIGSGVGVTLACSWRMLVARRGILALLVISGRVRIGAVDEQRQRRRTGRGARTRSCTESGLHRPRRVHLRADGGLRAADDRLLLPAGLRAVWRPPARAREDATSGCNPVGTGCSTSSCGLLAQPSAPDENGLHQLRPARRLWERDRGPGRQLRRTLPVDSTQWMCSGDRRRQLRRPLPRRAAHV